MEVEFINEFNLKYGNWNLSSYISAPNHHHCRKYVHSFQEPYINYYKKSRLKYPIECILVKILG